MQQSTKFCHSVLCPRRGVDDLAFKVGRHLPASLIEPCPDDAGGSLKANLLQMAEQRMDRRRPRTGLSCNVVASAHDRSSAAVRERSFLPVGHVSALSVITR